MSHASLLVILDGMEKINPSSIEKAVAEQMEPFNENGKEWFADGSRWDWWLIGGRYTGKFLGRNYARVKSLVPDAYKLHQIDVASEWFDSLVTLRDESDEMFNLITGITKETSKDEYLKTVKDMHWFPSFYACLRGKQWHENKRLGFFGGEAMTECEINGRDEGKCLFIHENTGAKIIGWNEPDDRWSQKFYDRFVKPLPPDSLLVTVDYHV